MPPCQADNFIIEFPAFWIQSCKNEKLYCSYSGVAKLSDNSNRAMGAVTVNGRQRDIWIAAEMRYLNLKI
jgi:hypothetical protein